MKCPACNVDLVMTDRQGIEIDYCSKCRGVWLDRGELDKIIERSTAFQPDPRRQYESHNQYHGDGHHKYRDEHKKDRRKSFLQELFD